MVYRRTIAMVYHRTPLEWCITAHHCNALVYHRTIGMVYHHNISMYWCITVRAIHHRHHKYKHQNQGIHLQQQKTEQTHEYKQGHKHKTAPHIITHNRKQSGQHCRF